MMSRKFSLLAVAAFAATVISMVPAQARAGGAEMLRECLESVEGAARPEQARSMCLWKHYEYMASYGP